MLWWHAIILGLVEGITEYLPVSSTGHLILVSSLLGLTDEPKMASAVDAYSIIIQGGAILAVLGLYWSSVQRMIMGLIGKDPGGRKLVINLMVAFLPAAVLGLLLNDAITTLLFNAPAVITALVLGGIYMIWLDRRTIRHARSIDHQARVASLDDLSWKQALVIGMFQTVAMWPGTSRSMMTITAGVLVGLSPKEAARFSFLLGLPTLGAATAYSLAKNLYASQKAGEPNIFAELGTGNVVLGVVVATISAAFAVRWLVSYLNKHGLAAFGWYRLVLGAVFVLMVLMNVISL